MFSRKDIKRHLDEPKQIGGIEFRQASKSRNMPRFMRLKSSRIHHTDLMDAGGRYRTLFLWRDGLVFERRLFSAWLFLEQGDDLVPLARLDYHPSHKGFHVHLNCEDDRDLANRALPGCKDLALKGTKPLDPAFWIDRQNLVNMALERFNMDIVNADEGLFS